MSRSAHECAQAGLEASSVPPDSNPARPATRRIETAARVSADQAAHRRHHRVGLGHEGLLLEQPWPVADADLARDETVTIAVQVSGKLRATIEVARDMAQVELEKLALANDNVVRAIDGKPVRKVIVVPNRIVNVVV